MTSVTVTAEAAARYDGQEPAPVLAVAGSFADASGPGLRVMAANGTVIPVRPGQWVVQYGPGDCAVMDDGEYRRHFGDLAAPAER
jgi:hypothetical protein